MSLLLIGMIVVLGVFRPYLPIQLDSDTLYLDDLWLSLTEGNGMQSWFLPPSPAFFPDLPLIGALHAIPDVAMRHGLFGLATLLLSSVSLAWIARQRLGLDWEEAFKLGSAGGLLLGLALMLAPAYQPFLRPGQQGGTLLASLWLLALAPDLQGSTSLPKKLSACFLTALMTLSDRNYLTWGVIPVLVSQWTLWTAQKGDDWKAWCAWVAGGWVLGEAWIASLSGPGLPMIVAVESHKVGASLLSAQFRQITSFFFDAGPAAVLSGCWLAWKAWQGLSSKNGQGLGGQASLSRFVMASAGCAVLAGIILGGSFSRSGYPIFLLPLLVLPFEMPGVWACRLPLVAAGCLLLPYGLANGLRQRKIEAWPWAYPPAAMVLDKALHEDGRLKLGMAHYRHARQLRFVARSKPVLLPIIATPGTAHLETLDWIVDASIFKPLESGKAEYILMDGLDAGLVKGAFGRPKRVIRDLGHELWVYR